MNFESDMIGAKAPDSGTARSLIGEAYPMMLAQSQINELPPAHLAPENHVDEDIRAMLVNTDLNRRLEAAARVAAEIGEPTLQQVRQIAAILKNDRSDDMRCAAAMIFGTIAQQAKYRGNVRPPAELAETIAAMEKASLGEQWPKVRIAIMNAAGNFDSPAILPVFQTGKNDFDFAVRSAALSAEYRRESRIKDDLARKRLDSRAGW